MVREPTAHQEHDVINIESHRKNFPYSDTIEFVLIMPERVLVVFVFIAHWYEFREIDQWGHTGVIV